jgi:hypothetical protein
VGPAGRDSTTEGTVAASACMYAERMAESVRHSAEAATSCRARDNAQEQLRGTEKEAAGSGTVLGIGHATYSRGEMVSCTRSLFGLLLAPDRVWSGSPTSASRHRAPRSCSASRTRSRSNYDFTLTRGDLLAH